MKKSSSFQFWISALCFYVLSMIIIATISAALYRYGSNGGNKFPFIVSTFQRLGNLPFDILLSGKSVITQMTGTPSAMLVSRDTLAPEAATSNFPHQHDTGYLLLSGLDSETRLSSIKLIRINDGRQIARWLPDWSQMVAAFGEHVRSDLFISESSTRAIHPLPLPDGDIIFHTLYGLTRVDPCGKIKWVVDVPAHHSIELDEDGKSIWTSSYRYEGFINNSWLNKVVEDNGLLNVSLDGQVISDTSFARVLIDNGMHALLLGSMGFSIPKDPLHLNQITAAKHTTRFWQSGDLLISSRHLSAVFLYRPSTGKIVWHKQGPWMNQHSAHFISDHEIGLLDNNVIGNLSAPDPYLHPGDENKVLVYNFESNQISEPYKSVLEPLNMKTRTEGRVEFLDDGGLFIEETNFARHVRTSKNGFMWSRLNEYDKDHLGMVNWSRYLTAEEGQRLGQAFAAQKCAR